MKNLSIYLKNLAFSYANGEPIIDIPHWQLARGKRCFLYGPSGCGKTTLLNLIGGVIKPNQGELQVVGQDLMKLNARQKDNLRANKIGMIFQQFNLVPYLTVIENIQLATHFSPQKNTKWKAFAHTLFKSIDLSPSLFSKKAGELSVGQQQRVAIVRSLINQPELLVADEPTSALDSDNRDSFMSLLLSLTEQQHTTMLFVSHDKSISQHFDNVISLRDLNRANAYERVNNAS